MQALILLGLGATTGALFIVGAIGTYVICLKVVCNTGIKRNVNFSFQKDYSSMSNGTPSPYLVETVEKTKALKNCGTQLRAGLDKIEEVTVEVGDGINQTNDNQIAALEIINKESEENIVSPAQAAEVMRDAQEIINEEPIALVNDFNSQKNYITNNGRSFFGKVLVFNAPAKRADVNYCP